MNITTSSSSVVKGECLRDTILTVQSMACDAIVMRHPIEGAAAYAADVSKAVIINAGDGAHAHPSQGLLDMFTIREQGKDFKGLKMAIVGDILYSVLHAPTLLPGRNWRGSACCRPDDFNSARY